jgi:hypothetical protein
LCTDEWSVVSAVLVGPKLAPFLKSPLPGGGRYGIFRLTEPTGLSTIIKCKRSALFHEHPDVKGGIYTDADGGHVKLTSGGGVEVIDLRRRWGVGLMEEGARRIENARRIDVDYRRPSRPSSRMYN